MTRNGNTSRKGRSAARRKKRILLFNLQKNDRPDSENKQSENTSSNE